MVKRVGVQVFAFFLCLLFAVLASAAASFPQGTFTSKDPRGSVWALTFDGKGQFTVTQNGEDGVQGTYKVTKDKIEFMDQKGPLAEAGKVGTYTWKLAGKSLTFTKIKDEAEGRSQSLTGGPWERKEMKETKK